MHGQGAYVLSGTAWVRHPAGSCDCRRAHRHGLVLHVLVRHRLDQRLVVLDFRPSAVKNPEISCLSDSAFSKRSPNFSTLLKIVLIVYAFGSMGRSNSSHLSGV